MQKSDTRSFASVARNRGFRKPAINKLNTSNKAAQDIYNTDMPKMKSTETSDSAKIAKLLEK